MPKIRRLRDYDVLLPGWDWDENSSIGIDDRVSSSIKYWWRCHRNHSYKASINKRLSCKTGCPICAGNSVSDGNRFSTNASDELRGEWNSKNECSMADVSIGSDRMVWWKCSRCDNEWQTGIRNRTKLMSGCPKCNKGRQSSRLELRIFAELSNLIPDVRHRQRIGGKEVDVFLASHRIAIEIDGFRWHSGKEFSDSLKNDFLAKRGIRVIRIREKPLKETGASDLLVEKNEFMEDRHLEAVKRLAVCLSSMGVTEMSGYDALVNPDGYFGYSKGHSMPDKNISLVSKFPDIALLWHPGKNFPLTPEHVSFSAAKRVWWKCGFGHEWEASVNTVSRVHGTGRTGCPYCAGKIILPEKSLASIYPEVVKIWSPRNEFTPAEVSRASGRKAWCRCLACGLEQRRKIVDITKAWLDKKDCRCRSCKVQGRILAKGAVGGIAEFGVATRSNRFGAGIMSEKETGDVEAEG